MSDLGIKPVVVKQPEQKEQPNILKKLNEDHLHHVEGHDGKIEKAVGLEDKSKEYYKKAGEDVKEAGAHVVGAGKNFERAGSELLSGVNAGGRSRHAGIHVVLKKGHAIGTGVKEGIASWIRDGALNMTFSLKGLADHITDKYLPDGKTVNVKMIAGDPDAKRLSAILRDEATSFEDLKTAYRMLASTHYSESMGHMLGAGKNLSEAAAYTAGAAKALGLSVEKSGHADLVRLAAVGNSIGATAADYAAKGVEGSLEATRDMLLASVEINGAVANALAQADQGKVEVKIDEKLIEKYENILKAA